MLMQLNKPRLRGKRRGRIQSDLIDQNSTFSTMKHARISGKASRAAAAVLVASFLIINSPGSVQAAPSPLHTSSSVSLPRHATDRGSRSISESALHDRSGNANPDESRRKSDRRTTWGIIEGNSDHLTDHLIFVAADNSNQSPIQEIKRKVDVSEEPTPTLYKRGENVYATTPNASARSFNIPASFTSNLANAWDPGARSVWFQRKAVIITSIFLAIFIVLIIGCTVFLRDKRDDELDEEYDVSDEAALRRMRDEREMRLGSRGEKKSKKRRKKDEQSSNKEGGDGKATAIVASRWARLPTRKIRLRKKKSTGSSTEVSEENRPSADRGEESNNGPTSLTGGDTPASNGASELSQQQISPITESYDSQIPNEPPPLPPAIDDEVAPATSSSATAESSSGSNRSNVRVRLNAADLDYAEEEEERMRQSDALPPAYISNQNRGQGSSNIGPSSSPNRLHPSADRQLAGQSEEALVEARGDSKRPMPAQTQDSVSDSDLHTSVDEDSGTAMSNSSLGLQGHIATDDKTVLSRMRDAASRPDSTPNYAPSAPGGSSLGDALASAPEFTEEDEIREQLALSSGASQGHPSSFSSTTPQQAESSSRLPAPPVPHVQTAFSRFDLPYTTESGLDNTKQSTRASEKAKEAAEEERQTAALLASRPDDSRILPQYQADESNMQPSAPEWEDGPESVSNAPSIPSVPSAPPHLPPSSTDDDDDAAGHEV